MKHTLTTWYLEMRSPDELRPAIARAANFVVQQAAIPSPELSRFLYSAVGGDWYWIDRLGWSYARWREYLENPAIETWLGLLDGTPAGYFELEQQPNHEVELAYFGLLPQFIGRGIGGALLTAAVQRAWQLDAQRVWVYTCSLDGPHALANYQARGFRLYDQETEEIELPDEPPGPWPGARATG